MADLTVAAETCVAPGAEHQFESRLHSVRAAATFAIKIPLNDALQRLDSGAMTESERSRARDAFEARWNRWNAFRAGCAGITSLALLLLLLRA